MVITASRRARELATLVSNLGGSPHVVPTVGIGPADKDGAGVGPAAADVGRFVRSLVEGVDYAAFMTGTGVQTLFLAAKEMGIDGALATALNSASVVVVARSPKPKRVLQGLGIKIDAMPPREEATASGVIRVLRSRGIRDKRVAILWHGSSSRQVVDELVEAGASAVLECAVYSYTKEGNDAHGAKVLAALGFAAVSADEGEIEGLVKELVRSGDGAITFTSPPAARNLFEAARGIGLGEALRDAMNQRLTVAAVGPSTRSALESFGVLVDVMPDVYGMGAMMTALGDYYSRDNNAGVEGERPRQGAKDARRPDS